MAHRSLSRRGPSPPVRPRPGRGDSAPARLAAGLATLVLVSFLAPFASAQVAPPGPPLSIEETEALVHARYFEAMPEEQAARIGSEGAARLIEMLADPEERESHQNVLLALGICGAPGALEAISDWATEPREGELDRATFKAWQVLPHALGRLAEHDPRAVARLEAVFAEDTPAWHFRQHRGPRLARLAQRGAASALAETGLPSAGRALGRVERRSSDPELDAHLRAMRARHGERARARARERVR
ncbi:MAG: hypothetical protein H6748_12740 [Spirochaetaceae bacterium]|nr:hypothetical protein [Myxococcales bacterium]MCB9724909.1 hypothetical protein [Spirochaetaceae bacterium]HPG26070.1 hypothetical protein [Myxococcota bacterium]